MPAQLPAVDRRASSSSSPSAHASPATVERTDFAIEKHMSTRSGSPQAATSSPPIQTTPDGPPRGIVSPRTCGHGSSASVSASQASHVARERGLVGEGERDGRLRHGTRAAWAAMTARSTSVVASASRWRYSIARRAASCASTDDPPTASDATRMT